jgi:hypothetical protein
MNDQPANGDAGRLLACRACGNRVARAAPRCPACGAHEPTGAVPPPEALARPSPPPRRWGLAASLLGAALAGAAVSAVVLVLKPSAPPPAIERGPETPAPAAEPSAPAPVIAPPAAPEPSRSRGRPDWLFFFKAGDQLVRMGDNAPIGMVLRTVPTHAFPDGTVGPAYLVQSPDGGGQRFVDADELERGSRLQ